MKHREAESISKYVDEGVIPILLFSFIYLSKYHS